MKQRRRDRMNMGTMSQSDIIANGSSVGIKPTHLSDKSMSKQTKRLKELNRKALAYIHSVR
ncbi:hypothetical protein [Pradoshia sp.]